MVDCVSPVLYKLPILRLRRQRPYKAPIAGPALNRCSDVSFTIEFSMNI